MQLSGIGVVILTSVSYVGLITVRGSPCESPHGASSVCDLSACDLSAGKDCSTLSNKVPHIASFAPASRAVTLALSPADRRAFEHLIGHALRETPAVLWATREFSKRMLRVLSAGAALNGTSSDAMMTAAFVTSHCGPWNTGYVGPSLPALRRTLASGNLREVWGLMYVLTKSHYFSHLMMSVLSPRAAVPPLTSAAELAAKYEMDAEAVAARYTLVRDTAHLNKSLGYAQGVPDFEFESFTSWVRFDFAARAHDGRLLWDAARLPKPTGCGTVELMSNDPSIEPPLSPDELAYQCAGQPPPCPLQWQPGALCYTLPNASWTLESGEVVPGVNERAALLGYRSAAAVSGTTANMLQLAELLGFGPHERVVLRATMAAWMLVTDDHSLFEILLGAESYVPAAYRMAMGMTDLGQLWPPHATLQTAGGSFGGADVWRAVGRRLERPEGQRLLRAMHPEARAYVESLVTAARPAAAIGKMMEEEPSSDRP